MEIQQHDGVVVELAGSRQGFAKLLREGEGGTKGKGNRSSLPPTIYRGPKGGRRP